MYLGIHSIGLLYRYIELLWRLDNHALIP